MDRFIIFERSWLGNVPPPRRPLLLFDGGWPFCRAAARLVARVDRKQRLALLSRDDEAAAPYAARIPAHQVQESWQLIEPTGVRLMHGPAGIRVLEYLPATRWLGWSCGGFVSRRSSRRLTGCLIGYESRSAGSSQILGCLADGRSRPERRLECLALRLLTHRSVVVPHWVPGRREAPG
jgi:predicted DCC family thiol-disulfide oxidoreductase YuxK